MVIPPFPTDCVSHLKSLGWSVTHEPNSGYWHVLSNQPEDYIGRDNAGEILAHDRDEHRAWWTLCYRAVDRDLWPIAHTETLLADEP